MALVCVIFIIGHAVHNCFAFIPGIDKWWSDKKVVHLCSMHAHDVALISPIDDMNDALYSDSN